jgi:hypothetical protein
MLLLLLLLLLQCWRCKATLYLYLVAEPPAHTKIKDFPRVPTGKRYEMGSVELTGLRHANSSTDIPHQLLRCSGNPPCACIID